MPDTIADLGKPVIASPQTVVQPQTIADLGSTYNPKPIVVGQSLLQDNRPWDQRIQERIAQGQAELEAMDQAGYDYSGEAQWAAAMRHLGRR